MYIGRVKRGSKGITVSSVEGGMLRGEGESMTIGANEDARFLNGLRAQRIFAGQQSPSATDQTRKGSTRPISRDSAQSRTLHWSRESGFAINISNLLHSYKNTAHDALDNHQAAAIIGD